MLHQFKKGMDAIAPHPGWHSVFLRQLFQSMACGWMLQGKKKVIMFIKQNLVQGKQSLPLILYAW